MSNRVRTAVVMIVTIVWALNFVASLAIPTYKAPPEINSIFMAVMGTALVATPMVGSRRPRNEEEETGGQNSSNNNTGERQQ